jgi:hypothetical protein
MPPLLAWPFLESPMALRRPDEEAIAREWDLHYRRAMQPWRSSGLGHLARDYLKFAPPGSDLLEIGCGVGDDAEGILDLGFNYHGIDVSREAVDQAVALLNGRCATISVADFFRWRPPKSYAVIYDKGAFHGLAGPRRRTIFARRVAAALSEGGIWITVCGAAEYPGASSPHSALFLTHLVGAVEPYFEILKVEKEKYGVRTPALDFTAWYGLFRIWR